MCFAGLDGYRKAVNRKATTGWQDEPFGGRPAYVMPNPSGLNANYQLPDLVKLFRDLQRATV